jgi:cytochrome P450
VNKPFELAGYTLQPGTRLFGHAYLAHHDPDTYPDPYAFRPERFLEDGPGTYTWIPFGGGRRRCLGKGIAELEIKSVVHEIFKRFEVRPDSPEPEATDSFMVVARPARDTRVSLSER